MCGSERRNNHLPTVQPAQRCTYVLVAFIQVNFYARCAYLGIEWIAQSDNVHSALTENHFWNRRNRNRCMCWMCWMQFHSRVCHDKFCVSRFSRNAFVVHVRTAACSPRPIEPRTIIIMYSLFRLLFLWPRHCPRCNGSMVRLMPSKNCQRFEAEPNSAQQQ